MQNNKDAQILQNLIINDSNPDIRRLVRNVNYNTVSNETPILPENPLQFIKNLNDIESTLRQNNQVIYLNNSSFKKGTLRITKPGVYIITEDIILEPNEDIDCFPSNEQSNIYPMSPGPYVLGFFAGITVECNNVVIDLNRHTIKQSIRFYLLQRFFSIIELANSPFIPKNNKTTQGPANFGLDFIAPKNVIIKNGTIGLSSHHAIHGNSSENILVENISINNFEVGGISLNGVKNVYIRNTSCHNSLGTILKVPVNGRFSAAVYLWRTLKRIVRGGIPDYYINIGKDRFYLSDAFFLLDKLITKTVKITVEDGLNKVPNYTDDIYNLFGNPEGFQDCSAIYGILFNRKGIAVNDFGACDPVCLKENYSNQILISNCSIANIVFKPREVVAILDSTNKFQKDFSGSVIMLVKDKWFIDENKDTHRFCLDSTFINNNKYDEILATQVLLYKFSIDRDIKWAKGVATITNDMINWVTNGNTPLRCSSKIITARNTDIMAHVMKGSVGIRLDFVRNIIINNNKISKLINHSASGINNNILKGYVDSNIPNNLPKNNYHHLGHPKSSDIDIGYSGNYVRGISCIDSNRLSIKLQMIDNLVSTTGSVFGIDIINNNKECDINSCTITNLSASMVSQYIYNKICFQLPNWIPRAIGILVRFNNEKCSAEHNNTKNIRSQIIADSLVIEADTQGMGYSINKQSQINKQYYEISDGVIDIRPTI